MGITEILYLLLAVYIIVLILCVICVAFFSYAHVNGVRPSVWVKVIFWPITVSIFLLGVMLSLSIKFFKGILLCFGEIKEYFVTTFYSAIKDENK
jgi:uncharacterized protein (DUF983 family)